VSVDRWLRWPRVLLPYTLAVVVGLGSAAWALKRVAGFGGEPAGPWRASTLAGARDADAYTRARVAIGGLLALARSETMYFVAATDSAGRPLRAHCTYRVSGRPPPARWWSVTAYGGDFFLFADAAGRYSLNGGRARLDADGRFALVSGPRDPGGAEPWLPTPGDGALLFTLRLYNPDPALAGQPSRLDPPIIERVGACA